MVTIITRAFARAHPLKLHGFDLRWDAGDLYATGGVQVRDVKVRRVYKCTGGGVSSAHTYEVVPGSETANAFRIRIYDEPAHTEVVNGENLGTSLPDESFNFVAFVD